MPDHLDLPDLFRRCIRKEAAACEAVYRWILTTADAILTRRFSNLSRVEREEAADRARYRIVEAMTLGRIDGVNASTNWPIIAYVKQVVENAARDVARQRHGTQGSDDLDVHPAREPGPDRTAIAREVLACVEQVLNSVAATDRHVFVLKCNGVSTRDVAADVHRLYQVVLTTQAIDTKFSRLKAKIERQCQR